MRPRWRDEVQEWPQVDGPGKPDLGFPALQGIHSGRRTYADVVITLAAHHERADKQARAAATKWEQAKRRKYPVYDNSTRRRKVPFDFIPLAFEVHGQWGTAAEEFVKQYGGFAAKTKGLECSAEVARWRACIAVAVQQANSWIWLGQGSAPFKRSRFELPLAGL